jgi:hypothetical protein
MVRTNMRGEDRCVLAAIEDLLLERHRLCGVSEVSDATGFPKHKCRAILRDLVNRGILHNAYGGNGKPDLYLPRYMMQELLRMQRKPEWMTKYEFPQKRMHLEAFEKARSAMHHYEMFESLLYATGVPLEEAVAYALDWLEFENVVHEREDTDNPDIRFKYEGICYVSDVKGPKRAANKDDVTQLDGWRQAEIISGTMEPDMIQAILIVNHYRELDPEERGNPLTQHGRKFMKMYKFVLVTTSYVFSLVKAVEGGKTRRCEARKRVIGGEQID